MTTFGKVNGRPLNSIMTDEDNCAARLLGASILMTMYIDDVVDINVEYVCPVKGLIDTAISRAGRRWKRLVVVVAVHELVGRPFDGERLYGLMQREIAGHRFVYVFLFGRVYGTKKSGKKEQVGKSC